MSVWDRHNRLLDRVEETERQIAFWQAQQQFALAAVAADPLPNAKMAEGDSRRWVAQEVAVALHLASTTAADRVAIAERLVNDLPGTLKMLEAGELSFRHARVAFDAVTGLDVDQIATIEAKVLPEAAGLSLATFSTRMDRAVHEIVPKIQEDRRKQEIEDRGVWVRGTRSGTLSLHARGLDPVSGAAVMARLNDMSAAWGADPEESRIPDQRRADALVALATIGPDGSPSVTAPVGVNVCVALSTLTGLDEQPGEIEGPGFIPGSPITAAQARLLAFGSDSTWRRLVTDALGRLIDYGRTKYRPPAPLADHVVARDRSCRFPTCNRRAASCELDHHLAWADGGETNDRNLGPACKRDHTTKHKAGWTVERLPEGTHRWVSPAGRTYTKSAETYPVDQTSHPDPEPDPDPPPF